MSHCTLEVFNHC